jgi:ubiquinone/menaquinone biosynthesis C-methylase UbiE
MFSLYWRLEARLAPGLRYSQDLFEETVRGHVAPQLAWLDLGCGHHLLVPWREAQETELVSSVRLIVGMDYDLDSLRKHRSIRNRVRGSASQLPFPDGSFDLVTANMVVEHLHDPPAQLREVRRVLKPGGCFLFHTPNALGYSTIAARMIPESVRGHLAHLLEGRPPDDVFRTYYRANTETRLRALAAQTGFTPILIRPVVSSAECAVVPPLAVIELLWIRCLMTRGMRRLRPNLIVAFRRAEGVG